MLRVGLTGGIACGKSHVLARLAACGLHTLDLDRIAHEVMAPGGSAHAEIVTAFGRKILAPDGSIDRKTLGAIVFEDAAARERLNALMHPRVREEEARRAEAFAADPEAIVVSDAALLVEAGVHLRFERLVVVHCRPEEQLRRLMERDRIDEASARARISAQMPIQEKRRFAHFEVDSTGSLAETYGAVDALAAELRRLAAGREAPMRVPLERALGCLIHGPARGPRGLGAVALLREILAADGPEMARLARLLVPPAEGPWYGAVLADVGGPAPATLAGPIVLWALARRPPDPPFVAAAAASLARLTHADPGAVAGAVLFALGLEDVAMSGAIPRDLAERLVRWSALAQRWGGGPAERRTIAAFEAAGAHPRDLESARRTCLEAGGDPDLAAALVGLVVGVEAAAAPPDLVELVLRLLPP